MRTASRIAAPPLLVCLIGAVAGCDTDIPHPVVYQDESSCRSCHGDAHKSACTSCHEPVDYWPMYAPNAGASYLGGPYLIPHDTPEQDDAKCLQCHDRGEWGARPSAHPELSGCVDCHAPAPR